MDINKIQFWTDKSEGRIDPTLYSVTAEELARLFAQENKSKMGNKRTQIRKFYDEVLRLSDQARNRKQEWHIIEPMLHMMIAKAAYANGRKLVSDNFLFFITKSVGQVKDSKDLAVFANFFEAFMGFYRMYES